MTLPQKVAGIPEHGNSPCQDLTDRDIFTLIHNQEADRKDTGVY